MVSVVCCQNANPLVQNQVFSSHVHLFKDFQGTQTCMIEISAHYYKYLRFNIPLIHMRDPQPTVLFQTKTSTSSGLFKTGVGFSWDILLMEEILHHRGCIKLCIIMG